MLALLLGMAYTRLGIGGALRGMTVGGYTPDEVVSLWS